MIIRRERPEDERTVDAVTTAAFGQDLEARLLGELRTCADHRPELSLVAVHPEGTITGHVICTTGRVGEVKGLGLGPISVHPKHQGRGVGQALMHAVLGAADALGEPFVALLGAPAYYRRFGFEPARQHGIQAPDPAWGEHFQLRPLTGYDPALRGRFEYAAPFEGL